MVKAWCRIDFCMGFAFLLGLRNDNIRHELRSLLKNRILTEEGILENLLLATPDEREYLSTFKGKQINISTTEASEDVTHPPKDKSKTFKPIDIDLHSLKFTIDNLTEWRSDVEQKIAIESLVYPKQVSLADAKTAQQQIRNTSIVFTLVQWSICKVDV